VIPDRASWTPGDAEDRAEDPPRWPHRANRHGAAPPDQPLAPTWPNVPISCGRGLIHQQGPNAIATPVYRLKGRQDQPCGGAGLTSRSHWPFAQPLINDSTLIGVCVTWFLSGALLEGCRAAALIRPDFNATDCWQRARSRAAFWTGRGHLFISFFFFSFSIFFFFFSSFFYFFIFFFFFFFFPSLFFSFSFFFFLIFFIVFFFFFF